MQSIPAGQPGTRRSVKSKTIEVRQAERRDTVMQLKTRGYTNREIAKFVNVSERTVKYDIRHCLDEYNKSTSASTERHRDMAEARYLRVVKKLMAQLDVEDDTKAMAAAGKIITAAQTRIDRLRGVDAPKKHETTIHDAGTFVLPAEMSMEEIEEQSKEFHQFNAEQERSLLLPAEVISVEDDDE